MTAATVNTKNTPTAEAIQEALAFLRNLSEKSSAESAEKTESFFNSDIFKTIEAALKSTAEAKNASIEDKPEEEDESVQRKKHAAYTKETDIEDEDEDAEDEADNEEDDDDDDDNPFAGDYYWNPGPEWKTIGLVAGGAALVGLGALLYKLFDD